MKNNSNDRKTQTGKRSMFFLWRVLFTTRTLVTWFFKRINEVKITTKVSCHSLCDRIVLRVFSCAGIVHNIDVWNIFRLEWCVCGLYAFRTSKDQISIGNCRFKCKSCQRLNRVVELECFCSAKTDCVVAKNNEAVEGQKDWLNPPLAYYSIQGLTPFVWIAGFFS